MSKRKYGLALSLVLAAGTLLGACGTDKDERQRQVLLKVRKNDDFFNRDGYGYGGVDDKSFNQSAWKGIQEFGKDNNLEEGDGGYEYLQSKGEADYTPNLNALSRRDFDLSFRYRFLMKDVNRNNC